MILYGKNWTLGHLDTWTLGQSPENVWLVSQDFVCPPIQCPLFYSILSGLLTPQVILSRTAESQTQLCHERLRVKVNSAAKT